MRLLVSKPYRNDPKSSSQTAPMIGLGIQKYSQSKTQDQVAG